MSLSLSLFSLFLEFTWKSPVVHVKLSATCLSLSLCQHGSAPALSVMQIFLRVNMAALNATVIWPVRIRHSSHDFGWQSSHSVDLAGWQAKMASNEIWIPWRNAHKPHSAWCTSSLQINETLQPFIYCCFSRLFLKLPVVHGKLPKTATALIGLKRSWWTILKEEYFFWINHH